METKTLSDQVRIDTFCRDLALILDRITGRTADQKTVLELSSLPRPLSKNTPVLSAQEKTRKIK